MKQFDCHHLLILLFIKQHIPIVTQMRRAKQVK